MSKGKTFPTLMAFVMVFALLTGACANAGTAGAKAGDSISSSNVPQEETLPVSGTRDNTPVVLVPSADGTVTYGNPLATIDASHADEGYIMAKYTGSKDMAKLLITAPGFEKPYQYTFRTGDFEVFPLTGGSESYTLQVMENVGGNQYATAFSLEENFAIKDELTPFLYPNQYINFTADSEAVKKGSQLARDAVTDLDVVANVYNFVIDNITYDTEKANDSQQLKLYLPDPDETLATGKGICFDYAALMVTMLRSQRIPSRLEIGYAGTVYHAWISAYVDDIGWIDGIIRFTNNTWTMMDPTFAASGKGDKEVEDFITDPDNYQTVYIY